MRLRSAVLNVGLLGTARHHQPARQAAFALLAAEVEPLGSNEAICDRLLRYAGQTDYSPLRDAALTPLESDRSALGADLMVREETGGNRRS